MKIIISPAKKMRVQSDIMEKTGLPVFSAEAMQISDRLKQLSVEELKALYRANDAITRENYARLQAMAIDRGLTPAVLSYVGLQYQSMAPDIFTAGEWEYVEDHLRILSGFYGILCACDGVTPYRLEMQAKLSIGGKKDLYEFWGSRLYDKLTEDGDTVIVNLASKEYSRAVEPWLKNHDTYITCIFGTEAGGKIKVKATAAKMARGEMVRFMASENVEYPEQLKAFNRLGYRYRKDYSSKTEYVFTPEES